MKKTKEKIVNLYNIDLEEENNKKPKAKSSAKPKKAKKNKSDVIDNQINLDNEIIIGMKPIQEAKVKNNKTKTKNKDTNVVSKKKKNEIVTNKKTSKNVKKKKNTKNTKNTKKSNNGIAIAKWTILTICLLGAIIFFMMSPIFNITEIKVSNNSKLSQDTIISLSGLNIGQNIFKLNKSKTIQNIKENAYIENVIIKRRLPNILQIEVTERQVTYMIPYGTSYAYINNQGYILEVNDNAKAVPIIIGQATSGYELFAGNRLIVEDLEKLETVIKIVENAASNDIAYLITKIDITDKQNYTLILEDEKKIVYLGDASDISTRILYLKDILIRTANKPGELFIDGDLNIKEVYFKEQII